MPSHAQTHASTIEAEYRRRTPNSAAFTARSAAVMPGGETRSGVFHKPYSLVLERAAGPRCWDIDGNDYLDLNNNYTCLIHGHSYPPIVEAAARAVQNGSTWAAKARDQVELAELLCGRVASVEQVRFANSGSEAVLGAISVARAHNGRNGVLLARYGFHGHLLEPVPEAPEWIRTFRGEFGNAEDFEQILEQHGDEIAAVMLEPYLGAAGLISAPPEFFHRVQAAAHKAGALFILDEATVFRTAVGGAQSVLGIEPDLSVLGKLCGGGFPAGVFGGRREFMKVLDPFDGKLQISGTFSGNPVSMAAGRVAVEHLTQVKIDQTSAYMARIEEALFASAARHGLPFSTRRIGALMQLYFSDVPAVVNQLRTDLEATRLFHLACLANGVFTVRRVTLNVSTAFTDQDLDEVCQRLEAAMGAVAAEMA